MDYQQISYTGLERQDAPPGALLIPPPVQWLEQEAVLQQELQPDGYSNNEEHDSETNLDEQTSDRASQVDLQLCRYILHS